jgi:hypothetical protein
MNKSKRLMTLCVWAGVVSVTAPLFAPPGGAFSAYACDPNRILSVRIAPDPLHISPRVLGTGQVTVTITCDTNSGDFTAGSTLTGGGTVNFKYRLVDNDTPFSDVTLGTATHTQPFKALGTFKKRIAPTNIFTLCCLNTVQDAACAVDSGENPADLAVEIDNGASTQRTNYFNGRVFVADGDPKNVVGNNAEARCVDETGSVPSTSGQAFASAGEALSATQPVANAEKLRGPHQVASSVASDPGNLQRTIGTLPTIVDVQFSTPSPTTGRRGFSIRGDSPFVAVGGLLEDDGSVIATGTGMVAGIPNVAVRFQGWFLPGGLTGDYTMGVNDTLPGQPITYRIEGRNVAWAGFWDIVGAGLQNAAQGIARLNFKTDLGGIDLSQTTMPMAGDFFQSESGVRFEERQWTVDALSATADRLTQLANSVAMSSLSNAAALKTRLQESASAFAAAAALKQKINERIRRVGDSDLVTMMNEWVRAVARAGVTLQSVGSLLMELD